MRLNLRKKALAGVLAGVMTVGILPTTVFATENDPVSKDKLETIVYEEVDKLDFSNLGIDNIINGINNTVTDTVTGVVSGLLTTDNIKSLIKPVVKGLVEQAIKNVNLPEGVDINKVIDSVLDNSTIDSIVDKVLTSQLTQDIIARTVEYAVADIMDIVGIPTAGEIVETSKEELNTKVVEDIWNANETLKKTLYYKYEIKLEGWRPVSTLVGWNRDSIAGKVQLDILSILADNTQAPDLSSINYEEIVLKAAKRAATDVVNEKVEEIKVQINTAIQNKIEELKFEAQKAIEQAAKDAINSIKNKFPWKK